MRRPLTNLCLKAKGKSRNSNEDQVSAPIYDQLLNIYENMHNAYDRVRITFFVLKEKNLFIGESS